LGHFTRLTRVSYVKAFLLLSPSILALIFFLHLLWNKAGGCGFHAKEEVYHDVFTHYARSWSRQHISGAAGMEWAGAGGKA
jgi:hypothetical protein